MQQLIKEYMIINKDYILGLYNAKSLLDIPQNITQETLISKQAKQISKISFVANKDLIFKWIKDSNIPLLTLRQVITDDYFSRLNEKIKQYNTTVIAEWEATTSKEPRSLHLTWVGRFFNMLYGVNGVKPAEEPNCKCGARIIDKKSLRLINYVEKDIVTKINKYYRI